MSKATNDQRDSERVPTTTENGARVSGDAKELADDYVYLQRRFPEGDEARMLLQLLVSQRIR